MTDVKLGLIGAKIGHSMAPRFHVLAGRHTGRKVTYELFEVDEDVSQGSLLQLIEEKRALGYAGLNLTYPVKQMAMAAAYRLGPDVAAIAAVNTLVFRGDAVEGHNTDYSGIVSRWEKSGRQQPGVVALLGAGGVGRAAAFAFARLGAGEIRVCDVNAGRAENLASDLISHYPDSTVTVVASQSDAVSGVDGVFNATPVGMYFMPGAPVDLNSIGEQRWLYDAIYAPLRTQLTIRATAHGLDVMDGFELFIGQGTDAYLLFAGIDLSDAAIKEIEAELRPLVESN